MSLQGVEAVKRDLTQDVSEVLDKFHNIIFKIVKLCKQKRPNMAELDSLHRILSIARDLDPLIIINRSKDKLWVYKDQIINEDVDFFMENKFSQFIKNDDNRPFMYTLVNAIKEGYKDMSEPEKKYVWSLIKSLLKYTIEYKKLTNDFKESL